MMPVSSMDDDVKKAIEELRETLAAGDYHPVDPADLESDLELAFFVTGWHLNIQKAAKAVNTGRAIRRETPELSQVRRKVRRGEITHSKDIPFHDLVQQYYHSDFCCDLEASVRASDGRPIAYTKVGESNLGGLNEKMSLDQFKLFMVHVMELRLSQLEGKLSAASTASEGEPRNVAAMSAGDVEMPVEPKHDVLPTFIDIHDLHCPRGFITTFGSGNVKLFRWWLSELGPCYPEQCSKVVLVNTPWAFYTGWTVAKGWLPGRTQEKIEILGYPDSWDRNAISTWVDPNTLEKLAGGSHSSSSSCS